MLPFLTVASNCLATHIFKGSLFGPYTPLQQLDVLADFGTKSYVVGSTNSLLLQQRDRYSDILINLDDNTVTISSPSLRSALSLTASDRRWIDYLTQEVNETWDDADPRRPRTMRYAGSEEFIRLQFEEYILSLIAAVKYSQYIAGRPEDTRVLLPHIDGDPSLDFGSEWVAAWQRTENYRLWDANTDSHLFDIVDPRHPCAGGLTIEDVQRRIAEQVRELHLDERLAQGREALGRNLAFGREKAGSVLNKLYADVEAFREAQRRRAEETPREEQPLSPSSSFSGVDLSRAQQTVSSVGAKAGAYVSSWAAWAGEKRKAGGGWGMWGRGKKEEELQAGDGVGERSSDKGRASGEVLETYEVRDGGFVAVERTGSSEPGAEAAGKKTETEENPRSPPAEKAEEGRKPESPVHNSGAEKKPEGQEGT